MRESFDRNMGAGVGSVLIVDDDPYIPEVLTMLLEEIGMKTRAARNGPEALRLFENTTFDIVITDLTMPGMNGLELASQIRNRRPAQTIFLLTGYPGDLAGRQIPCIDRLLTKPIAFEELRLAVEDALGRN